MPRPKGIKKLSRKNLGQMIAQNPTISTFEELCAFFGVEPEGVEPALRKIAEIKINRNITKLRVQLKDELLHSEGFKQHEMLYKLIATDEEIKRLKAGEKTQITNTNTNVKPTIEVKSEDPDILNKLVDL